MLLIESAVGHTMVLLVEQQPDRGQERVKQVCAHTTSDSDFFRDTPMLPGSNTSNRLVNDQIP